MTTVPDVFHADRVPIPLAHALARLHIAKKGPGPTEAMRRVSVEHRELQGFRPLSRSLEWELSEVYWMSRGVLPFVESEVPFAVNNSGRLSEAAAALLYANCQEREPEGSITVLEVGAGTALFARYFLDAFRAICAQEQRSYYDRLSYIVSDRSPRAVEQWMERDLFGDHSAHVIAGVCDGRDVAALRTLNGKAVVLEHVRAVFCNYVLDVLPSTIVRRNVQGVEELQIRTHLSDDRALLAQYTRLDFGEILRLVESADPADRIRLAPLLSLFDLEAAFGPCEEEARRYAGEALELSTDTGPIIVNHGALACLDACLERLQPEGFVLVNDYGPVRLEQVPEQAASQRFGATSAIGINFPLVERYFGRRGCSVVAPGEDGGEAIHARLLVKSDLQRTVEAFHNRFDERARHHYDVPIDEARRHLAAGQKGEALERYRTAIERNPRDWQVVGEAAEFVGLHLQDYAAGLELARSALAINPWYSTWLWNVLGDCLFCLERFDDAHEAYLQAHRIDPRDARTNLNLSYTYTQFGAHDEALGAIAVALANDVRHVFRMRLLEKQQQVLNAVSGRWLGEQERLSRRADRLRSVPGLATEPPPTSASPGPRAQSRA